MIGSAFEVGSNIIIRMQQITALLNNRTAPPLLPYDKDTLESDATSDSSFDQADHSPRCLKSLPSTCLTSPSITSRHSHHPQDDPLADQDHSCPDFFEKGQCSLGLECPLSHEGSLVQTCEGKRKKQNQILSNFPWVVVECLPRRINSFLQ